VGRTGVSMGLLVAITAARGTASADETTTAPPDLRDAPAAEVLFRSGRARMEAGDYAHACPLFAESLRLDPTLGTLFNLATCEEDIGKLASAWELYGEIADRMDPDDERRAVAAQRKAALVRDVPRMTVVLAAVAPTDLEILCDGVELRTASLGVPLPVDPGPHEIAARAPGYDARIYSVTIARGEELTLSVEPGPPVHPPRWSVAKTGYVIGGVGLASLAVGTILGVRALDRREDSDADCVGSVCRDVSGVQAYSDARSLAIGADVAFGVGAVAVAVGGYLAWFAPRHDHAMALSVTPTGVGATF
jgi:hypothetical protein